MPIAYLFIGQSGAGKGTQAQLLIDKLTSTTSGGVFHLETGARFREFIKTDTLTASQTRVMMSKGKLPPSFLGVHAWAHQLIDSYKGEERVVIDGTPRVPDEVPILLSAAAFYGWEFHVCFIAVSDEWAYERAKGRGREDDINEHEVWGRLQWFHESVEPAIELLKNHPLVTFHTITGEQEINAVHTDICNTLLIS